MRIPLGALADCRDNPPTSDKLLQFLFGLSHEDVQVAMQEAWAPSALTDTLTGDDVNFTCYFKTDDEHTATVVRLIHQQPPSAQALRASQDFQMVLYQWFIDISWYRLGMLHHERLLSVFNPSLSHMPGTQIFVCNSTPVDLKTNPKYQDSITFVRSGTAWKAYNIDSSGKQVEQLSIGMTKQTMALNLHCRSSRLMPILQLKTCFPHFYDVFTNRRFMPLEHAVKMGDDDAAIKLLGAYTKHPHLKFLLQASMDGEVWGRPIYLLAAVCSIDNVFEMHHSKKPPVVEALLGRWKNIIRVFIVALEIDLTLPLNLPILSASLQPKHMSATEYVYEANERFHVNPSSRQRHKSKVMLDFMEQLTAEQESVGVCTGDDNRHGGGAKNNRFF